ncbi:beta-carotene 15,15'-monooxygenase [Chryseobacterium chendengshani]|uniref:beta-carotene 15,15'-monooxygenase n=1 Tax=Chryseobacterium sp. LJ668 TaxID=2864040 RepID=UPI001C68CF32|nr:beta-carotene 15,15'-monooxygenase [Chryseobacterium sp. LJ668]MBW8523118.1 beta-carotene 15,15'-monooxygenase [Chryseobacterium sp. LJ668]QYK15418.1 beta-carotene 15,15'-monooxygenase [Chryseobacterium sp. LJ668]
MPEFDLDSFKKAWQEQPVQQKYDNNEILNMLNRKSRNYMKYIFWISVAEFSFFTIFGLFYILQNKESNTFLTSLQKLGVEKNHELETNLDSIYLIIKIVSLLVTGYFVIQFYQNYRKIKVEEDLKIFITRIINFKKTVNAFIVTNIVLFVLFTATFTVFVFYVLNDQNIQITASAKTGFIIGILISTLLCIFLIWIYYRLVYGIIMKRLDKNLKQLKEIESQVS